MIINKKFFDDMSSVTAVIVQVSYVMKLTDECFVERWNNILQNAAINVVLGLYNGQVNKSLNNKSASV